MQSRRVSMRLAVASLCLWLGCGAAAFATPFTTTFNFNTVEERALWTPTLDLATGPAGPQYNGSRVRLETDGVSNGIGNFTIDLKYSAPAGQALSNLVFSGIGQGYSTWGSSAQLSMSRDGVNYEVVSNPARSGFDDVTMTANATNAVGFNGITDVWLRLQLYDIYGFGNPATHIPHARNLTLSGSLEPLPPPGSGPRDPLGFKNSGLYSGWNGYLVDEETPFDHFLVQAVPYQGQSSATWNTNLQQARNSGKRAIAVLHPQALDSQGNYFGISELTAQSTDADLDKLVAVVDEFFTGVDAADLYAITLGEENIFWDGREAQLNKLYDKIKAKHDVPIFQWHSPSSIGTAPGISGWPNLKSDGWVSDEYHLDQPAMERTMRGYVIQQKPIINTVWAGGDAITSVPFDQERFVSQLAVMEKYDIPADFFAWSGVGGYWGWEEEVEPGTAARFAQVLAAVEAAKEYAGPDFASWDAKPWATPIIELAFSAANDVKPSYVEQYKTDRTIRFVNDTDITGFADLRWDSSAVELRPREVGAAEAAVSYSFASAFPITQLRISAPGFVNAGAGATISVLSEDGSLIQSAPMAANGTMNLTVPGGSLTGRAFKVVYQMNGTAAVAGQVLAGVNSLSVEADVQIPTQKVLSLSPAPNGAVAFREDLSDMSIFHTATFKNINKVRYSAEGLHAHDMPGTLEVIQKFSAPEDITLTQLRATGSAIQAYGARFGIGVSLDGVNVLAKSMSTGDYTGDVLLNLSNQIDANLFYVHLFLEGGYGVITSYDFLGMTSAPPVNPADFNHDGSVDGDDFLVWQRHFGATGQTNNSLGDADGNGVVNGSDLAMWKNAFGATTQSATTAAVPEPNAMALGTVAIVSMIASRRGSRRARSCASA